MRRNYRAVWAAALGLVLWCAWAGLDRSDAADAVKAEAPKNLVENGDFESGPVGPASRAKLPPGWARPFVTLAAVEIVEESRPGSPGKRCLKVSNSEKVKSCGLFSKRTSLDPKKPLHVSGWLKGGGTMKIPQGAYFGIGWYDAQNRPIVVRKGTRLNYYYLHSGYKEDKWVRREATYVPAEAQKETYKGTEIPPNAAFFHIMIFGLEYPKPCCFDDIFATQDLPLKAK